MRGRHQMLRAAVKLEAWRARRSEMKVLWATLAEWSFERGLPALSKMPR